MASKKTKSAMRDFAPDARTRAKVRAKLQAHWEACTDKNEYKPIKTKDLYKNL